MLLEQYAELLMHWQSNKIVSSPDWPEVIFQQVKQRDDALAESGELQRFVIDLDNFQIWLVFFSKHVDNIYWTYLLALQSLEITV